MLMRFDPFREVDRLAQQAFGTLPRTPAMPMDAYRHDDAFVVNFDLPGVEPDSIELTVEKDVLTVKAERSFERSDGDQWLVAERPQGTFSRQLFLGTALDTDHIEAHYDRGVLTLRIPVAEQAKPRRIQVDSSGQRQAIDASSSAA